MKRMMYFCACKFNRAAVAQSVEHQLPKLRVASSSLVCRSKFKQVDIKGFTSSRRTFVRFQGVAKTNENHGMFAEKLTNRYSGTAKFSIPIFFCFSRSIVSNLTMFVSRGHKEHEIRSIREIRVQTS